MAEKCKCVVIFLNLRLSKTLKVGASDQKQSIKLLNLLV